MHFVLPKHILSILHYQSMSNALYILLLATTIYIYIILKREIDSKNLEERERERENTFCEIKISEGEIGNLFFRYYSSKM